MKQPPTESNKRITFWKKKQNKTKKKNLPDAHPVVSQLDG